MRMDISRGNAVDKAGQCGQCTGRALAMALLYPLGPLLAGRMDCPQDDRMAFLYL